MDRQSNKPFRLTVILRDGTRQVSRHEDRADAGYNLTLATEEHSVEWASIRYMPTGAEEVFNGPF